MKTIYIVFALMAVSLISPFASQAMASELNIYSYRQANLLKPFLDRYTQETGVKFNVVHAPKGLAQRLKSEGESSPADLVLTVDISRLAELADMDLLTAYESSVIDDNVPPHLRSESGLWTALSTRARVIVVSKERVARGAISTIAGLADSEWRGRLCSRKGSHVYNRALLASLVVRLGEAGAESWARAYVGNLARRPQGNDRAQAKAIYAGECDIALMNTYYFGRMKFNDKNPEQRAWADALRIIFTDQASHGQHINISGGAIVKTAPNPEAARAFLEWLTEETAQKIYAEVNYEYPVNPDVAPDAEVASWGNHGGGDFVADDLSLEAIAKASAQAQMIIDRVNW